MKFIADFHIHSKHSRATAKNLDLENLYVAAQIKGLSVIGTGDFTHPAWWQELNDKLVPAQEGLFALKPELARACDARVPPACRRSVRFVLLTEISNIYKKNGRTRKNHNLIFLPDLESAAGINRRLDKIGNIRSDGRPILGLDARHLLEIVLETSEGGYLVPAHIWTPWFSLLGSKSGFDSVAECFEDLSSHIFALETGLSSDPAMNWRVSGLDRFSLISNSDAHSPGKLGREANLFDTDLSFTAIRRALSGIDADGFEGTIEFFPEEGKYHIDGHAGCGFSCMPDRSHSLGHLCPVCGKPLVLGVLYRVQALADRLKPQRPAGAKPYISLIPLEEILAEIYQVGAGTKRVAEAYSQLLRRYGSECDILRTVPRADLDRSPVGLLGEAIERMRNGSIHFKPGFDGVYGRVRIFEEHERNELRGQITLFPVCGPNPPPDRAREITEEWPGGRVPGPPVMLNAPPPEPCFVLNVEQQSVVDHPGGPLLIVAGPGTGKTRTITSRMASLMVTRGVPAHKILAVTFTNKAAQEMLIRLAAQLPPGSEAPLVTTFHGLCRKLLLERGADYAATIMDDEGRTAVMADALKQASPSMKMPVAAAVNAVVRAKQLLLGHADDLSGLYKATRPGQLQLLRQAYCAYQNLLKLQNACDFEDLIFDTVHHLESEDASRNGLQQCFTHIFVDEFQDINYGQYRLIRLLAPPEADLCVIGDPDQSIYGFRGSDAAFFKCFQTDYPQACNVRLKRNYRSTGTILQAAYQVVQAGRGCEQHLSPARTETHEESFVSILEAPSPLAEAVAIGKTIEQMVGGAGFQAQDFGKITQEKEECSFADFAILYRISEQGQFLADVLTQAGIPCQLACRRRPGRTAGFVKLPALLRMIADRGSYADLDQLNDLIVPGVSRETLGLFKAWAYATRQSPAQAMHAAARVPIPGMSLARQQRLAALIKAVHSMKADCAGLGIPQIIQCCLAQTTLSGRIEGEDLQSLLRRAADFDRDLTAFLAELAFQRDTDLYRQEVEKVSLMTLHASKGLEFNIVFVAGCEEGLIPHRYPGTTAVDPEEERRLFFVGMTRAKRRLFLTWSRKRALRGKMSSRERSSYVDHIESRLKRIITQQRPSSPQKQLSLF